MNWYKIAIKLKKTDTTKPDLAISSIKALGIPNPLNQQETIINNVKVSVSPYDDKTIWLKSIESMLPQQGNGTIVLKKIIDIANQNGVAIYLDPMPFGDISNKNLVRWYMSNGCVKGEDKFAHGLIHYP